MAARDYEKLSGEFGLTVMCGAACALTAFPCMMSRTMGLPFQPASGIAILLVLCAFSFVGGWRLALDSVLPHFAAAAATLLGAAALGALFTAVILISGRQIDPEVVGWGVAVTIAMLGGRVFGRISRSRTEHFADSSNCLSCGYRLECPGSERCPECGSRLSFGPATANARSEHKTARLALPKTVAWLLIGVLVMAVCLVTSQRQFASLGWRPVAAEAAGTWAIEHEGSRTRRRHRGRYRWNLEVEYRYSVGGTSYRNNRLHSGWSGMSFWTRGAAEAAGQRVVPAPDMATVYHDPAQPGDSALVRGPSLYYTSAFLASCTMLSAGVGALYAPRRARLRLRPGSRVGRFRWAPIAASAPVITLLTLNVICSATGLLPSGWMLVCVMLAGIVVAGIGMIGYWLEAHSVDHQVAREIA